MGQAIAVNSDKRWALLSCEEQVDPKARGGEPPVTSVEPRARIRTSPQGVGMEAPEVESGAAIQQAGQYLLMEARPVPEVAGLQRRASGPWCWPLR